MTIVRHLGHSRLNRVKTFKGQTGVKVGTRKGLRAFIAARWAAAQEWMAPLGYEDESGFHYGCVPTLEQRSGKGFVRTGQVE